MLLKIDIEWLIASEALYSPRQLSGNHLVGKPTIE